MTKSELLKKLREMTQAGFMDCKKALDAVSDDLDAAVKWLREKGISKAASKNAHKVACEGTTWAAKNPSGVALLELNSQTDFTGRSAEVLNLAQEIIQLVLVQKTADLEKVLAAKLSCGDSVQDACLALSAKTGEKIALRRVAYTPLTDHESAGVYRHDNGKISSFVVFDQVLADEKIKGVAMHLTAMNPKFLNPSQVDPQWLKQEKDIIETQLKQENKPVAFAAKIIEGRVNKALAEVCLVSQEYILESGVTVGQYIETLKAHAVKMVRFELGEGIEKAAAVDFATEVAAQMRK